MKGAQALANRITGYWLGRGHEVCVEVIKTGAFICGDSVYCVRSDMVGGLPATKTGDNYHD